jgi:hypothetical protein
MDIFDDIEPPQAAAGAWTKLDNARLWDLYRAGTIDPHNNDRDYLFQASQTYFPHCSSNKETAIRRLRDKNKLRRLELQQQAAHSGKLHSLVWCCARRRPFHSASANNMSGVRGGPGRGGAVPPPAAGGPPLALPGAGAGAGGPADPVGNLVDVLGAVSIGGAYKPFSFAYTAPHMIFTTPFAGNSRKAYIDVYVHSQHESAYKVEINDGGTALALSMRIPTIVTSSDRLTRELTIAGNHDSIIGGHNETVDAIIAEHGTGEIWTEEQEIILPFACDREFNKRLIWHDGDTQLYADFSQDANIERAWHQMCPILCVELTSSSKKVTRYAHGSSRPKSNLLT